jgi:hypothetical protein
MNVSTKKVAAILILTAFILYAPPVFADAGERGQKFGRGFVHLVTAPFHLPKEIIQTTAESEPVYLAPWRGITVGIGRGLYQWGRQWVSAGNDIFTFWRPGPPLYEPETLFPGLD